MRGPQWLVVFVGLASLSIWSIDGCGTQSDTKCDLQGCISEAMLSANISSTLQNKVVGYVSIIGDQPAMSGGEARTACDPPITGMSSQLPTNVASVSKIVTTIGVLQSLSKNKLTIDDPISPYIYPDWIQGPNVSTITFRDLLTHRSGIRADCNGNKTTYAVLKTLIALGVKLEDKAVADYNNCNFAIFRELIPVMERHSLTNLADAPRASASAGIYMSYINQNVFQPVGVTSNGTGGIQCMPPPTGTPDILSYPFPAGSDNGTNWGDWTLACGAGGWVLTAADLFRVVNDLARGKVLLTSAEKSEMVNDCLGWDCSTRTDCPNPYPCKNGHLDKSDTSLWAYVGIFKCSVPVVVIVNSALPSPYQDGTDIVGLVESAYQRAGVAGTAKPCS